MKPLASLRYSVCKPLLTGQAVNFTLNGVHVGGGIFTLVSIKRFLRLLESAGASPDVPKPVSKPTSSSQRKTTAKQIVRSLSPKKPVKKKPVSKQVRFKFKR